MHKIIVKINKMTKANFNRIARVLQLRKTVLYSEFPRSLYLGKVRMERMGVCTRPRKSQCWNAFVTLLFKCIKNELNLVYGHFLKLCSGQNSVYIGFLQLKALYFGLSFTIATLQPEQEFLSLTLSDEDFTFITLLCIEIVLFLKFDCRTKISFALNDVKIISNSSYHLFLIVIIRLLLKTANMICINYFKD